LLFFPTFLFAFIYIKKTERRLGIGPGQNGELWVLRMTREIGSRPKRERRKIMPRNRQEKRSDFLKALGKLFEIFKIFVDAVLEAGGSDEDISRIGTDKKLLAELVAVVMKAKEAIAISERAAKEDSIHFNKLLTACRQLFDRDFKETNLKLEPVETDENEWKVDEIPIESDKMSIADGFHQLEKLTENGEIRLCGLRRAMEYIAALKEKEGVGQMYHPIIIPVRVQCQDNSISVPIFTSFIHGGFRRRRLTKLSLFDLDMAFTNIKISGDFTTKCTWLILRKRPSDSGKCNA
jgi:hypothetical protein